MIDGFEIRPIHPEYIEKIYHHPKLKFMRDVYVRTGDEKNVHTAFYEGLRFTYIKNNYSSQVFIRGNLPFYHTGMSNYTNLSLEEARRGLYKLVEEFELDIETTQVIKLEWGLNVTLPVDIPVSRFLNNIMVYGGRLPVDIPYEGGGRMVQFNLNQYNLKIYDKSAQHNQSTNILRYELAIKRKAKLNRLHIHTLQDLFEEQPIRALQAELLDNVRHLVFYDHTIDIQSIPLKRRNAFFKLKDRLAWVQMKKGQKELYRKKRKLFREWMTEASGTDWNQLLYDALVKESNCLLQTEQEQQIV